MKQKNPKFKKLLYGALMSAAFFVASEINAAPLPQCSDGLDNDMDGLIDNADTGCSDFGGIQEFNVPTFAGPLNPGGLLWHPKRTSSENLLINSGFENASGGNADNWSKTGAFSVDTTVAKTGTNSMKLFDAPSVPYSESAKQNIPVIKGLYTMRGWIKMDGIDGGTDYAEKTTKGVRLNFSSSYGGGNSIVVSGTTDWRFFEVKNMPITQDNTAFVSVSPYSEPIGMAWFDDLELVREIDPAVEAFLKYPNYKGYLFDDQSQIINLSIGVNPPNGTTISDYRVENLIVDELTGEVLLTETSEALDKFEVTINGASLENNKNYLIRTKLIPKLIDVAEYEYPPYRIMKRAGNIRADMPISVDENNRILFEGQPKFMLGVYDSGLGYSVAESTWQSTFTNSRKLFELPINSYINYWYGISPLDSMNAMMNVLKNNGISYFQTGNCFSSSMGDSNFKIYNDDNYAQTISQHAGLAGFYTIDECTTDMVPKMFDYNLRMRSFDADGATFSALINPNAVKYWRDSADLISMDPYPIMGAEPAGGYNIKQVADWTRASLEGTEYSRPTTTVLQFFKGYSAGHIPTRAELRNMSYMAIAEGSNGLFYWSLGNGSGALATVCSGWCQEKIDHFENLKAVLNEINLLQEPLSKVDSNELLLTNSNTTIHTRVKYSNGKGYLIASNNSSTAQSVDFQWSENPSTVSVIGESRLIETSNANFSDSFAPFEAHVYEISTVATCSDGFKNQDEAGIDCGGVCNACIIRKYSLQDFIQLKTDWLKTNITSSADTDVNKTINAKDLGIMMSNWQ
ncbi:MAG: Carbohydrate-binding CenC protein [uncultured bacterium]|nr:MAG: Carbohydrate-binding CenC protein [uncultured bacterium]